MRDYDSLDQTVDRALEALAMVARTAERHGALDLRGFADEAREGLFNAWERAE